MMTQQLKLDFSHQTSLSRENFFVAPSNKIALSHVDDFLQNKNLYLVITGPAGSGKTHLVDIWSNQFNGEIIQADEIEQQNIIELVTKPVAVEDIPKIADNIDAQLMLFNLFNLCAASQQKLLLTGRNHVNFWGLSLEDLKSRIEATPVAALGLPDDELLTAVLAKLFVDRQIIPKPTVIPYLVAHMERSFNAAQKIVEELDNASLAQNRKLTVPLVSQLLHKMNNYCS
ncbi:MAG: chromosomal replication initiator DnaA [Aestuariivita sp.]|nr:chromosomal replication initiator DnaA [Aestuariivita sp.]